MRSFNAELMGRAALTRLDDGEPLTWDRAVQRMSGFEQGLTKPELCQVIAFLAASILQAAQRRDGGAR